MPSPRESSCTLCQWCANLTNAPTRQAYQDIVRRYAREIGLTEDIPSLCVHSLRVTGATNALSNHAAIAKVQEWLRHSDISTTGMYDKRQSRPEESPTCTMRYEVRCSDRWFP
jgi:site-specific recombinase XerD